MKPACIFLVIVSVISILLVSTTAANEPIKASAYPAEALKLADELAPELAVSIKTCSVERARKVDERINQFIYKEWSWTAYFKQLQPYRVCFQMLSDISATTLLVTDRHFDARPSAVAGMYDSNYSACRKLTDPTYRAIDVSDNMKWPSRFGPEPSAKPCSKN